MSRTLYSDPISPKEFAQTYLMDGGDGIETIQDLWDYMDTHPDEDYWDYPLEEMQDIMEQEDGCPCVLVADITGEMRWFETDPTPSDDEYFNGDPYSW